MMMRLTCMVCHEIEVVRLDGHEEYQQCPAGDIQSFYERHKAADCIVRMISGSHWVNMEIT